MIAFGINLAIGIAAVLLWRFNLYGTSRTVAVSPDGHRYLAASAGEDIPRPFALRWFMPLFLKTPEQWAVATGISLALLGPAIGWYVGGSIERQAFAALLVVGLPGVFRFNVLYPVLTDAPAMLLVVVGAAAWLNASPDQTWLYGIALICSVLAATIKEFSPIFLAAASMSPWPLLGIAAPALRWWTVRKRPSVQSGFATGLNAHIGKVFDAEEMILPWGACLAACFAPSWWILAAVALGYAQLAVATDRVRLYQWSFPLLVMATVDVVPRWAIVPIAVAHLFHPWKIRI